MSTSGGGKNLRCSSVLVVQVYVQFWVVQLIMKCDFVECIKNSRNKNNQYQFIFLVFPPYITFYSFVLSLFSLVSLVLPVNHRSLSYPKTLLTAVSWQWPEVDVYRGVQEGMYGTMLSLTLPPSFWHRDMHCKLS